MTTHTVPVGASNHTETTTLKARYDEALAIKEAWDHRVLKADEELAAARRAGEGVDAAVRKSRAVGVQHEEAVAYMGVCLDAWLDAVDTARHRAAVLAVRAGRPRGGVIGHGGRW